MRYFLKIHFLGTAYSGWQRQLNAVTVQEVLEEKLSTLLNEKISTMGAGRTDAGVHAKGLLVHFDTEQPLPDKFLLRLNYMLPEDIAVLEILLPRNPSAHVRFDALWRSYTYSIHFEKDPFISKVSLKVRAPLNAEAMQACASMLPLYRDYLTFSKAGSDTQTTLCHIHKAEWEFLDNEWRFHIQANRFLRGMVRLITGSMIQVGRGRITTEDFRHLLEFPGQKKGGPSAEPHGLTFTGAAYPDDYFLPVSDSDSQHK